MSGGDTRRACRPVIVRCDQAVGHRVSVAIAILRGDPLDRCLSAPLQQEREVQQAAHLKGCRGRRVGNLGVVENQASVAHGPTLHGRGHGHRLQSAGQRADSFVPRRAVPAPDPTASMSPPTAQPSAAEANATPDRVSRAGLRNGVQASPSQCMIMPASPTSHPFVADTIHAALAAYTDRLANYERIHRRAGQ